MISRILLIRITNFGLINHFRHGKIRKGNKRNEKQGTGVPAMAQWVKNLTAVAQVAAAARI